MKTTYTAAAFFSVAAVLTAAALMKIDRGHASEQASSSALVSQQETEVNVLQEKLDKSEEQLRAQLELTENARQDAIAAGIQGDGAQDFVYVYQREQAQADLLEATLVPQIKQIRATIATLTGKDSELSSLAQGSQP
jgi:hypothetical protein